MIIKKGKDIPFSNKFYTDLYYVYKDDNIFNGIDFEIIKNFSSHRASYILSVSSFIYEVDADNENKVISYVSYRLDSFSRPILYFAYTVKDHRNKGLIKGLINKLEVDSYSDLKVSFVGSNPMKFGGKTVKFMRCGV